MTKRKLRGPRDQGLIDRRIKNETSKQERIASQRANYEDRGLDPDLGLVGNYRRQEKLGDVSMFTDAEHEAMRALVRAREKMTRERQEYREELAELSNEDVYEEMRYQYKEWSEDRSDGWRYRMCVSAHANRKKQAYGRVSAGGRKPQKEPTTYTLSAAVGDREYMLMRRYAHKERLSVSAYLRKVIQLHIRRHEKGSDE